MYWDSLRLSIETFEIVWDFCYHFGPKGLYFGTSRLFLRRDVIEWDAVSKQVSTEVSL